MVVMNKPEKYAFPCECGQVLSVEAQNRDEAVEKLLVEGREHIAEAHPDLTPSDEDFKSMVRSGMKQVER